MGMHGFQWIFRSTTTRGARASVRPSVQKYTIGFWCIVRIVDAVRIAVSWFLWDVFLNMNHASGPKKSLFYCYDRRWLRLLSRSVCPVSSLQSILLEYVEILLEKRIYQWIAYLIRADRRTPMIAVATPPFLDEWLDALLRQKRLTRLWQWMNFIGEDRWIRFQGSNRNRTERDSR